MYICWGEWAWGGVRTIRLLTRICRILAFRLVRPLKVFWSSQMRMWPSGALTRAPYAAILGTRDVK